MFSHFYHLYCSVCFGEVIWNWTRDSAFYRQNIHSGSTMLGFFRRLYLHYGIYRRYPLAPLPALKNAWRISRA
jgi:hypothetical protein